jgi:hypothetical protein
MMRRVEGAEVPLETDWLLKALPLTGEEQLREGALLSISACFSAVSRQRL